MIAFAFPGIIVLLAAYIVPILVSAGLGWWAAFILVPAACLSVLICFEFWATAVGFDAEGVRYRAVGYRIDAPWSDVEFQDNGGKPVLLVSEGRRTVSPWFAVLFRVAGMLAPHQARASHRMMASIPLYYFLTADTDAVMADLHAVAPTAVHESSPLSPRSGESAPSQ